MLKVRSELWSFPLKRCTGDFVCEEGWVAENLTRWGVSVGAILARADPLSNGQFGLVSPMDKGNAYSLLLERLRESMLAIGLNGERLHTEHGEPTRLVPTHDGRDCWESLKWVKEIEIAKEKPSHRDTAMKVAVSRIE